MDKIKENIYNIPNVLTLFRIFFIPIIVYGIFTDRIILSALFFFLSNITDIVDGYIARKTNTETEFGEYFDFIADFIAIYAILISFIIKGDIGLLNTSLLTMGTVALAYIAVTLAKKAGRAYMPHRISSKLLAVMVSVSIYLFIFNISFADLFLLLSFAVIYFYTIPDYLFLLFRMKGGER